MYHQCILKRNYQKLKKKIIFIELINEVFKTINENPYDTATQMASTNIYKMLIKTKIKAATFKNQRRLQANQLKVKDIPYSNILCRDDYSQQHE